eukprot:196570_1
MYSQFRRIEIALGKHYLNCDRNDYYDANGESRFMAFINEHKCDENQMEQQLENANDCMYQHMDDEFPLLIENENSQRLSRNDQIFRIIKYCFVTGAPPQSINDIIVENDITDPTINEKEEKNTIEMIEHNLAKQKQNESIQHIVNNNDTKPQSGQQTENQIMDTSNTVSVLMLPIESRAISRIKYSDHRDSPKKQDKNDIKLFNGVQCEYIINTLKHELYDKIAHCFEDIVKYRQSYETDNEVLKRLQKAQRIDENEITYIKNLILRLGENENESNISWCDEAIEHELWQQETLDREMLNKIKVKNDDLNAELTVDILYDIYNVHNYILFVEYQFQQYDEIML